MVGVNTLTDDGADETRANRTASLSDAFGVGFATGVYGLSFGAIAVASGLSVVQTSALSLLMFTGASQFALVGVLGGGGGAVAAAATALLLGSRNALYGLHLSPLLRLRGVRKAAGAQLMIDESVAMALRHPTPQQAASAYWATGLSVFLWWNLGTVTGAVAGTMVDAQVLGLDAAVPAAFVALLAPRMDAARPWTVALGAAAVALVLTPLLPPGLPVLAAALVAVLVGVRGRA